VQIGPGTRVLVTGASRGIGEAVASAFAARGCEVGRVSRSGELAADVADPDSIASAVSAFGVVDVLVANAGIAYYRPFKDMPLSNIEELTRVNWMGTVHTVRATLPGMLERRRGQIAIVSSGAGLRSFPNAAVYGATKAAQRGFGEALRHELKGTGVGLTMVYPDRSTARCTTTRRSGCRPGTNRSERRRRSRSRRRSWKGSRRGVARSSTLETCGCFESSTGSSRDLPTSCCGG
jgi:short-subunit dehydrogenase